MENLNFINHHDPTGQLDLDQIDIRTQYSQLTDDEKILVFLKLNGYTHRPPTIERLYSDEYYLGSEKFYNKGTGIFDFWKSALPKIYPNEVLTAKPYLVLSGAIGIGKSTISKLCLAMTYARLGCMSNPYKVLGILPKPLSAVIFHRSESTAEVEFKHCFEREVKQESPFFKNLPNRPNFKLITSGPRGGGGLGSDVLFFLVGEVNFWPNEEQAMERVNSSIIRFQSRWSSDALSKVGQFIIDSSAKGSSGPTELFLENTDPRFTWNCRPAHYEVRTNMYTESAGRTFSVYTGDGKIPAQIMAEDSRIDDTMDPDKVIQVPIQKLGEYRADLIKSLQDISGISTGNSDSFFNGSIESVVRCSKLKNRIPETIKVDFYNKSDRIIDRIEPALKQIPPGTFLFIGLDLAVTSDTTGISGTSFSHWESDGNSGKIPHLDCHFLFGVTRHDGQETSLFHIYQFIMDLSKRFNLLVSADQAFSRNILQDLEREGIQTKYISTDRTPEPSNYLKNLLGREQIQIPEHKRFQRECLDLKVVGPKRKVDHPKHASVSPQFDNPDGTMPGSKDIWDALASSVYACNLAMLDGDELGYNVKVTKQMDVLKQMTTDSRSESTKQVQNMLENIF